jgi:hypothetical protein
MSKPAALLFAALLAAGSVYAQTDEAWPTFDHEKTAATASRADVRAQVRAERQAGIVHEGEQFDGEADDDTPSTALRYQVVGDAKAARAAGVWPVRDYDDAQARTTPRGGSRKASQRRPRKEYPNVMGITFQEWLASHP